ncbi:hypothetical protein [Streptomyces shenzhenensis]|nr:hypothetical protein [Streptomyces shenzhenensis]
MLILPGRAGALDIVNLFAPGLVTARRAGGADALPGRVVGVANALIK